MLVRLVRPWMHYETGRTYDFFSNLADVLVDRGICEKVEEKPETKQQQKPEKARK